MDAQPNYSTITTQKPKKSVLIVDEAPASLSLLFDYLRGFGFGVLVAKDGESALELAAAVQPDIILLEANMTGLNGYETCRRLKSNPKTDDIPVIFITTLAHPVNKVRAFRLGAAAYLTKPLQCEEVLAHITAHLNTHQLQQNLKTQNKHLQLEQIKHKRFLTTLHKRETHYRRLAQYAADIISKQSPAGIYHYVSPACENILGYTPQEMVGRSMFDFFHPDDLLAIENVNRANGQQASPVCTLTYRIRRKNAEYIWLESISQTLFDPKTFKPMEVVSISRNITERKQAEVKLQQAHDNLERRLAERVAELAEANAILQEEVAERKRVEAEIQAYSDELKAKNEMLSRLDKMKNEFLASTSHELRTPLNGITGIAESMLDGATGPLTPEQMHNLAMIVFSGRRLTNLVNNTLDFSKLKHRELDLELKAVDLHSIVDVVLTMSHPLIGQKPIRLLNQLSSDLPAVKADESRIQQILYNLIGNAIKFTEAGVVSVSAKVEGDMIAVTVADTGIGIYGDKLEIIFQPFEQGDASSSTGYGGTGLGLSITKQLVELHGGTIKAESVVNEGSRFTFTLPLHKWPVSASALNRAIDALTDFDEPPERRMQVEPTLVTLSRELATTKEYTILVVDDELINVQVLTNYLSMQNYAIAQAFDGFEALEALEDVKPDLILLDVMMPKMSGYEVCVKIRQRYPAQELPIMLLTAKNQPIDLVAGFEAGANDYLTKPFDKNELLARVKTHIRLAKINAAYGRFVPHEFLRFLDKESIEDVKLGDQIQREMTILFADIRSFTSLSENMTPQENFNFLNSYLGQVSPIIRQHHGFIDKYIGDAVMALFPDTVEDALKAAIAIQHKVQEYNQHRHNTGYRPIKVGIGLHTGLLMLGTVGEAERMESTVIADAVNMASRMEGLTKVYGAAIIVSENALFSLQQPDQYHHRFLGRAQVKGKQKPVSIFEIFNGDTEEMIALKVRTHTTFTKGLKYFYKQQFNEAKACFQEVLKHNPEDQAAQLYSKRAAHILKYGVSPDFEGIEVLPKNQ
jgi:PAS domain S-box-containing protein